MADGGTCRLEEVFQEEDNLNRVREEGDCYQGEAITGTETTDEVIVGLEDEFVAQVTLAMEQQVDVQAAINWYPKSNPVPGESLVYSILLPHSHDGDNDGVQVGAHVCDQVCDQVCDPESVQISAQVGNHKSTQVSGLGGDLESVQDGDPSSMNWFPVSGELLVKSLMYTLLLPKELKNSDGSVEPDADEEIFNPNKAWLGRIALKCLRVIAHSSDYEERLLSIIHKMSIDENHVVRTDLMDYVPYMAMFCDSENLRHVIEEYILVWVLNCLSDPVDAVKKAAQVALIMLVDRSFISTSLIQEKVCAVILQHTFEEGDGQTYDISFGILRIMCHIAKDLCPEEAESLFLEKFCSLAKHTSVSVRQVVATNFINFAGVISGSSITNVLVPLLVEMCGDEDIIVRKLCSVVVLSLSCMVSVDVRKNILSPTFLKLLSDKEESVQNEAFCSLGPFISTFAVPIVADLVYTKSGALTFITREGCEFRLSTRDVHDHHSVDNDTAFHPRDLIGVRLVPGYAVHRRKRRFASTTFKWRKYEGNSSPDKVLHSGDTSGFLPDKGVVSDESSYNSFQFWRDPIAENYEDMQEESKMSHMNGEEDSVDEYCLNSPSSVWKSRSRPGGGRSNTKPVRPAQNVIPEELLDAFLSMASFPVKSQSTLCSDLTSLCAFNLPAVALTLGKENWVCLQPTHQRLADDADPAVRRAVVLSLHVIAAIVGKEIAVTDLVPIFYQMMEDDDEVKTAALDTFYKFLEVLPNSARKELLPLLKEFSNLEDNTDWRNRQSRALQLQTIIKFFDRAEIARHLKSLVVDLLQDRVAQVRETAIGVAVDIIHTLWKDRQLYTAFFHELVSEFAKSSRWQRRQTYAYLCLKYYEQQGLVRGNFIDESLPLLVEMSGDKVANVRIAVARVLKALVGVDKVFNEKLERDEVVKLCKTLYNDVDFDVRYYACCNNGDSDDEQVKP